MMGISSRQTLGLLLLAMTVPTVFCDSAEEALGFLRSLPQFEHIRQTVRVHPHLLNAFVQQLGQANPVLLQAITDNQEEFLRLLNEDTSTPGSDAVPMTSQDRDAIERLQSEGFPQDLVAQTYFALDKNETIARNFLLQSDQ